MAKELTRKEKQITELYIETIKDVGKNADNWISFLKRASYNYKYKFDEQILIYAQKPDAVACAETTIWNKKLKRWVNKGAKGIALITEKEGELGLRFVFDVSDTNSNVYGRKLKLWKVEEKYTEDIIETLEDRFGTMEDKSNLPFAIISTVYNHIVDNMQDYLEELKNVTTNSKLEKLGQEELENSFLEILIYSTIAVTMSRCGLDVNEYIRKDCFKEIENFNTFETMSILGTATRDFSKEILLEISKTVINLEKQEKNKNYTFEKLKQNIYNKENEKGSVENENNLQSERELSNTRLDNRENKLGRLAKMRLAYLKQNKRGTYTMLVGSNKLTDHLIQIQEIANKRIAEIVEQMKKKYGITEELKANNQMEWVGQMNNIQATAEQIVIREIIYN